MPNHFKHSFNFSSLGLEQLRSEQQQLRKSKAQLCVILITGQCLSHCGAAGGLFCLMPGAYGVPAWQRLGICMEKRLWQCHTGSGSKNL